MVTQNNIFDLNFYWGCFCAPALICPAMMTVILLNLNRTRITSNFVAAIHLRVSARLEEFLNLQLQYAPPTSPLPFFMCFGPLSCYYTNWTEEWDWEQISTNSFTTVIRLLVYWSLLSMCCLPLELHSPLSGVRTVCWILGSLAAAETAGVATCLSQLCSNNQICDREALTHSTKLEL